MAIGNRPLDPEQFWHRDVAPLVSDVPTPDGEFNLGDVLLITRKALGIAWQERYAFNVQIEKNPGHFTNSQQKRILA